MYIIFVFQVLLRNFIYVAYMAGSQTSMSSAQCYKVTNFIFISIAIEINVNKFEKRIKTRK